MTLFNRTAASHSSPARWVVGLLLLTLGGAPANAAGERDATVVLGAGAPVEGWANPVLAERVCRAVLFDRKHPARKLVMSGGYTAGHISEAEMMRLSAVAMGAAPESVVLENAAVNTEENARFSARLLKKLGAREIALVSSGPHLPRARAEFEKAGVRVSTSVASEGADLAECFRFPEPSGGDVDMLIIDVGGPRSLEDVTAEDPSAPDARLVDLTVRAAAQYRAGRARRLYFAMPYVPVSTGTTNGSAAGHISRTEKARVLATAMGVALDDLYFSSGRRQGQVPGAIEPAENPWLRVPRARLAVWAPAEHRSWWEGLMKGGLNALLRSVTFTDLEAAPR